MSTISPKTQSNNNSGTQQEPQWSWQSNQDPWNKSQKEEWVDYTHLVNRRIEEAYNARRQEVDIPDTNYKVLFDYNNQAHLQLLKSDSYRRRPVRREMKRPRLDEYPKILRDDRFRVAPKLVTGIQSSQPCPVLIAEYNNQAKHLSRLDDFLLSNKDIPIAIINDACDGIYNEGSARDNTEVGRKASEDLRERTKSHHSQSEIAKFCLKLHTRRIFLYTALNQTLENESQDSNKVLTLGPFGLLVFWALNSCLKNDANLKYSKKVFKGVKLPPEMITEYKNLAHQTFTWKGFTSTTKSQDKAEALADVNAVFVIDFEEDAFGIDLSNISEVPDEEEVLLSAHSTFKVTRVEEKAGGKYMIYLLKQKQDFRTQGAESSGPKWYFQSNSDPWANETPTWRLYSSEQTETIEKSFSSNMNNARIGDYIIYFGNGWQEHKDDSFRKRPIRRDPSIRQDRFVPATSDPMIGDLIKQRYPWVITEYSQTMDSIRNSLDSFMDKSSNHVIRDLVSDACKGMVQEATAWAQRTKAEELAGLLRSNTGESLAKTCIELYMKETFLYKALNIALGKRDVSKVGRLGAFSVLLFWAFDEYIKGHPGLKYTKQVFRGALLTPEIINAYTIYLNLANKENKRFSWDAFTSTTKDQAKAEPLGNALFVISFEEGTYGMDVSGLSEYKEEEEVLLNANSVFILEDVKQRGGKYIIQIKKIQQNIAVTNPVEINHITTFPVQTNPISINPIQPIATNPTETTVNVPSKQNSIQEMIVEEPIGLINPTEETNPIQTNPIEANPTGTTVNVPSKQSSMQDSEFIIEEPLGLVNKTQGTFKYASSASSGIPSSYPQIAIKYGESTNILKNHNLDFSKDIVPDSVISEILKEAYQGIIHEGEVQGKVEMANRIATILQSSVGEPKDKIAKLCIQLYTQEAFISQSLNKAIEKIDKILTLGPFCLLLCWALNRLGNDNNLRYSQQVYKGAELDDDQFLEFSIHLDQKTPLIWKSFTATTKNRTSAEASGNALFIISFANNAYGVDVGSLPGLKGEEVLLDANSSFTVQRRSKENGKRVIYLEKKASGNAI